MAQNMIFESIAFHGLTTVKINGGHHSYDRKGSLERMSLFAEYFYDNL